MGGGGQVRDKCIYKLSLLYAKMNRPHRCGALEPQPTQTCAGNKNKHIAKLFCA